jgi:hypothetical protein
MNSAKLKRIIDELLRLSSRSGCRSVEIGQFEEFTGPEKLGLACIDVLCYSPRSKSPRKNFKTRIVYYGPYRVIHRKHHPQLTQPSDAAQSESHATSSSSESQ